MKSQYVEIRFFLPEYTLKLVIVFAPMFYDYKVLSESAKKWQETSFTIIHASWLLALKPADFRRALKPGINFITIFLC